MVASALRLGWAVPSPFAFLTGDKQLLHLREVCPAVVRLHAMDDLRRREATTSSLAERIGGAPDLEPLADFLVSKKARGSPAAGSLRALGEGGWWTQERLHRESAEGVQD
eukprot:2963752-Heterocapsa_arctica.AAC.1